MAGSATFDAKSVVFEHLKDFYRMLYDISIGIGVLYPLLCFTPCLDWRRRGGYEARHIASRTATTVLIVTWILGTIIGTFGFVCIWLAFVG